jgi:hypothetical protein
VTLSTLFALFPLMLALAGVQPSGEQPQERELPEVRQLVVNQQVIMRVHVRPRPPLVPVDWVERDGPKCLSIRSLRGALLSGADHVDFLLVRQQRVRARFSEECPALDFYGDFYLKPESDKICAGRDFVHSRIGGSCRIEGFQHLVPKVRQ